MTDAELPDLLQSLAKKDSDLEIVDVDPVHGTVDFISDLPYFPNEIESRLIFDTSRELEVGEEHSQMMDVALQILERIFLVNATISFVTLILGIIPYGVLSHLSSPTSSYLPWFMIGLWVGAYFVMIVTQTTLSIIVWATSLPLAIGSCSYLLEDISPLQTCCIIFVQSLTFVVYANIQRRGLYPWLICVLMLLSGTVVWVIGIYVFIEENDWLTGGILVALTVAFAFYSVAYILYGERFSLSDDHIREATCEYYGFPIYWIIRKCRAGRFT